MKSHNPATLKKILRLWTSPDEIIGVTQLSERSGLSRTILHKYVKVLVGQGELQKAGKGPHTKYKRIGDGMSEHITNA
jgi:response regulator of citrate/malate metabolism